MEVMSLKSFIGGIHPKDQKQYTKDLPIIKIKASDEVVFPLKQHIGAPCQPIVKVKDEIKVGQVIACSDGFKSYYFFSFRCSKKNRRKNGCQWENARINCYC